MISLVISKLYQIQPLIPRLLSLPNVHSEHVFKVFVGSFSMSIHFRMICKTHTNFDATQFKQRFSKFTHKFSIYVTNYLSLQSIIHRYLFKNNSITPKIVIIVVVDQNRATIVINDHKIAIKAFLSPRKIHNEIHNNGLSLPIGYH